MDKFDEILKAVKEDKLDDYDKENPLTKKDFHTYDNHGKPVLLEIAKEGHLDKVSAFLKKKGEKFDRDDTSLTYNVMYPFRMADDMMATVLHYAAEKGQLDAIKDNLDTNKPPTKDDFTEDNEDGVSPIAMAMQSQCLQDAAEIFAASGEKLDKYFFLNTKSEKGQLIHVARTPELFKSLADYLEGNNEKLSRADLQTKGILKRDVFFVSIGKNFIETVDEVLKRNGERLEKKDLKVPDRDGETAFHMAIQQENLVKTVEILRGNGENVSMEDVMEGMDKIGKERKSKILYDKKGAKLSQLCDAELFDLKALNKFWKETPEGFKTPESEKVYLKNRSSMREAGTKVFSAQMLQDVKGR